MAVFSTPDERPAKAECPILVVPFGMSVQPNTVPSEFGVAEARNDPKETQEGAPVEPDELRIYPEVP
jgi:hypothetical protein